MQKTNFALQDIAFIDNHRDDLRCWMEAMPAARFLGLVVAGLGAGVSRLELPIRPELTADGSVVQAGIVGTLADFAAVSAATAAMPEGWAAATTGLEMHNLAPARGERLVAVGAAIHAGKGHSLGESRVYAIAPAVHGQEGAEPLLVATAMASCRLFQRSG